MLIIYLMSPPVSDAVQGAFFVAAFISGFIFGALSLVFTDITDGLGCLLGGFCLSMWFLTLKEGGLIDSTAGRAIFIACMSFAAFSLSFSHYTRTYGLIVSISFAGATIAVLGIDCLSRAGLKEFWLYLWNLNSNTFPLNTNTYPITRGIRVEVACIVLIFLFGLVSQLKLWKLVKERRERNAAVRLEQDQNQEREEEELGRRIEDDFMRERAQWEAAYGDKHGADLHPDSAIGSSNDSIPKTSVSVKEVRRSIADSVEMVDLSESKAAAGQKTLMSRKSSKRDSHPTVIVRVLQDNDIQHIDADGNTLQPNTQGSGRNPGLHSSTNSSLRESVEMKPLDDGDNTRSASARTSLRSSVPPPPLVVPLPFTIPAEEESDEEDRASVSTVPDSLHKHRPSSKRVSGASALNRFSMSRNSTDHSESREALIIPHIEDDRDSSVAATLDGLDEDDISLPELSPPHSPLKQGFDDHITAHIDMPVAAEAEASEPKNDRENPKPDSKEKSARVHASEGLPSSDPEEDTSEHSGKQHSLTISTDPKPNETKSKRTSMGSQRRRSGMSVSNDEDGPSRRRSKSLKSIPQSEGSEIGSHVGSLKEILPAKLSKVALSYRTNEWAKHLELAEKPELDEIEEPESPGVKVDHGFKETAAPLKVEVKPQPSPVTSTQLTRDGSQTLTTNPYRQGNSIRPSSSMSKHSTHGLPPAALSRTPSSTMVNSIRVIQHPVSYGADIGTPGTVSRSSSATRIRGLRSSSTPLMNQTLVESPIEEELQGSNGGRFAPSPVPGHTLMGKRETSVRNKVSTMSYAPFSSTPNVSVMPPSDSASVRALRLDEPDSDNISLSERKCLIDQENMTLAQRKQLIQSQQLQSQLAPVHQRRQGTWPLAEQQMQGFDSHQPKRTSGMDQGKREAMLATWRESMRNEMSPVQPVVADEGRRAAMLNERRQKEMEKQQQAIAANHRDTVFDSMMRRGDMLDAHKEAMRRMQAAANKHA